MSVFALGCLFALLGVGSLFASLVGRMRAQSLRRRVADRDAAAERAVDRLEGRRRLLRLAAGATGVVAVLLIVASMVRVVPANTIGIPTTFGSIGDPMPSGIEITAPWTQIHELSTRIQELSMLRAADEGDKAKDDSITVIAPGGGSMKVDLTVRYAIEPGAAGDLFRQAGTMDLIKERFVRPDAREVARNVFSGFTAEEGYSIERARIAEEIFTELKSRLERRGIIIDSINVRDVEPEAQVLQAINSILQARNEALRAQEEQTRLITEAETRREVASRDAEASVLAAQGQADSVRITAEAEADANAAIAASLTADLIELQITQACAEAIAKTQAAVVSVCGRSGSGSDGTSADAPAVIVDSRGP